VKHYSEESLILHYYGENATRAAIDVETHLERCPECAALYRQVAETLGMIRAAEVPERGDQYGLEVWQRIRHHLSEPDAPWWNPWARRERLAVLAAAAALVLAAFIVGQRWPRQPARLSSVPADQASSAPADTSDVRRRVLLTSVADHFDRSERVLTEIVNASDHSDISSEQEWADDLLTANRLYRQDAVDSGEYSVASVLDDLERSLLEIVHSPSPITETDLEQIRRRIDAAALLFKVRVMSDEIWQRERGRPERPLRRQRSSLQNGGQS
jgi:hypothetical protein